MENIIYIEERVFSSRTSYARFFCQKIAKKLSAEETSSTYTNNCIRVIVEIKRGISTI